MNALPITRRRRRSTILDIVGCSIVLGLAAALLTTRAYAEDPVKPPTMKRADQETKPVKSALPKIKFNARGLPWPDVFQWLSKETGKPVLTPIKVPGSFTLYVPEGAEFTLPDTIDLINEALIEQKHILVQRERSFGLLPADVRVDPVLVPIVPFDQIDTHGNTELVRVQVGAGVHFAEDIQVEIKRTLSNFGEVSVLPSTNTLIITDTVRNIRNVKQMLDNAPAESSESYSHVCEYIKSREAERILKDLLGDMNPKAQVEEPRSRDRGDRWGGGFDPRWGGGGGFDPRWGGGGGFDPRWGGGGGGDRRGQGQAQMPVGGKNRIHYITSDDAKNMILVTGGPDIIAKAKDIVKRIDVQGPGGQKIIPGAPIFRNYEVASGRGDAIAGALKDHYKDYPKIRISSISANTILVYATPEDHFDIAAFIKGITEGTVEQKIIPLEALDCAKVSDTLKQMFGDVKSGGPFIEPQEQTNSILIKGSGEQVRQIQETIRLLEGRDVGAGGAGSIGRMRVITLKEGSAASLAEALEEMMKNMRQNPIRRVTPNDLNKDDEPPVLKPKRPAPMPDKKPEEKPGIKTTAQPAGPRADTFMVRLIDDGKSTDTPTPGGNGKPKELPGDKSKPVTITAFGNRIVVTSDDPEALRLASELIRLYTQTPGGEGDFQIIQLKYASANEAARVLDELFNGPRQPQQGGQRGGGGGGFNPAALLGNLTGGLLGGGGPGGQPAKPDRIRIVADPATNILLVRASPLDLITIRKLLKQAIDNPDSDSQALVKTWYIGPLKYAQATDAASLIRDVYREKMGGGSAQASNTGGLRGFTFFGMGGGGQQPQQGGGGRGVQLSIGIDDRTNSLALACSEALKDDILVLVDEMEKHAKDATRSITLVPLKNGIDPYVIERAVEAIQGQVSSRPQTQPGGLFGQQGGMGGQRGQQGGGGFQGGGGGFGGFQGGGGGGIGGLPGGGFGGLPGGGIAPGGGGGGRGFGGGGGGGRRGGGGRTSSLDSPRGHDFFEQRVMDDPQVSGLYDPQLDSTPLTTASHEAIPETHKSLPGPRKGPGGHAQNDRSVPTVRILGDEEQQQDEERKPITVTAPRRPVTVEALPELGQLIIRSDNPEDAKLILELIDLIIKDAEAAEISVEIVELKEADCVSVVGVLSSLFQRVNVGPRGNTSTLLQPRVQTTQGGLIGTIQTSTSQPSTVVLIPLPRFNAILVATPKSRQPYVRKEIEKLDKKTRTEAGLTPFKLKKAGAARMAAIIQNFWAARYPGESQQNQIRVTYDDTSNTVFVQASPGDLAEIRQLVDWFENLEPAGPNDLRFIQLKYAVADELAFLLMQAVSQGLVVPTVPATSATGGGLGGAGGLAGVGGGAGGGVLGLGGAGGVGGAGGLAGLGGGAGVQGIGGGGVQGIRGGGVQGLGGGGLGGGAGGLGGLGGGGGAIGGTLGFPVGVTTHQRSIRFRSPDGKVVETGFLADIFITPDVRTNSLLISAPEKTMQLLMSLIGQFDVPPAARAEINIFPLKKADATTTGTIIQQLFLGTATGAGGISAGQLQAVGADPQLVGMRLTVDTRTNSIIAAGSPSDLLRVQAIINTLEASDAVDRVNKVYSVRNSTAADLANSLTQYYNGLLTVAQAGALLNSTVQYDDTVLVVPEPITNKLLISASPRSYPKVLELIEELDAEQPMVVIQVMIASLGLTGSEEFGIEVGLQLPVLFQRSINGNVINNVAGSGFNFNTPSTPGFNLTNIGPNLVGVQGLTNFGTGRVSSNSGLGGFVFTASSEDFNLLIRALKTQGRAEVLSRPQIMTMDNQFARVLVGTEVPYSLGSNVSFGTTTTNISYRPTGVELQVTPKITPDGRVIMRVVPTVSRLNPQFIDLGNGQRAPQFDVQTVETTVTAIDGETVAIGGLITATDAKTENKVPWLGDLPGVGSLFRFRSQTKNKAELMVILTPHIVRNRLEADRIMAAEARRLDWSLGDVIKYHATTGYEPLLPGWPNLPGMNPADDPGHGMPPHGDALPLPRPVGSSKQTAPPLRPVPAKKLGDAPVTPTAGVERVPTESALDYIPAEPAMPPAPMPMPVPEATAEPKKEAQRWRANRK